MTVDQDNGQDRPFELDFIIWLIAISVKKGQITVSFETQGFEASRYQTLKLQAAYLSKVGTSDKRIPAQVVGEQQIRFEIEDATQAEHYAFYEVVGSFEVDGRLVDIPLTGIEPAFQRRYFKRRKFFANKARTRGVFPTLGYYDFINFFVDDRSRYDHLWHRLVEYATTVLFQKKIVKSDRKTLLLFEKDLVYAQDNSFALFEWYQVHRPKEPIYYVIQKDARQLSHLLPYKRHVVYAGSLKYYWLLLRSQLLVSSETPNNLYTEHNRKYAGPMVKKVLFKKTNVMLQHGVIAMKRLGSHVDPVLHASSGIIDYFNASTGPEKALIEAELGFEENQIPMLGLARWDRFEQVDATNHKQILYMPTWRRGLFNLTDQEFIASDYYQGVQALLTSPLLAQYLASNAQTLVVYLHPFMQRFSHVLVPNNARIRVIHAEQEDLPPYIASSARLITDYSSVAWDFAFQRKRVDFYQFDREAYLTETGSYIDLADNPLGNSYENVPALIAGLDSPKVVDYDHVLGPQSFDHCQQTAAYLDQLLGKTTSH